MQQYLRMKAEHPGALLFFRMGDFYEMFFEDAVLASQAVEITLTSRGKDREGNPIPMCGVPHHAASSYIARLVKLGHRVALCEQVEGVEILESAPHVEKTPEYERVVGYERLVARMIPKTT